MEIFNLTSQLREHHGFGEISCVKIIQNYAKPLGELVEVTTSPSATLLGSRSNPLAPHICRIKSQL
jgi:hypothetical protein